MKQVRVILLMLRYLSRDPDASYSTHKREFYLSNKYLLQSTSYNGLTATKKK